MTVDLMMLAHSILSNRKRESQREKSNRDSFFGHVVAAEPRVTRARRTTTS